MQAIALISFNLLAKNEYIPSSTKHNQYLIIYEYIVTLKKIVITF